MADQLKPVTIVAPGFFGLNTQDSSVTLPTGAMVNIMQKGAGEVSVTGATGVSIQSGNGYKSRAQYSLATVIKLDTDSWVLIGDIEI